MKLAICISALMIVAAPAALAQQSKPQGNSTNLFGGHNSNAPINVSADNFVGDIATKVGTYVGNVIVIQGDMKLRADTVKVHIAQGKPTRIEANGKVVVNAQSGNATGDYGVYEMGPRTITMTGRVVLTKDKDVMRGTKLVMNMNTNLAHMYAQGMPGNRVQGMFIPPPQGSDPGKKGKAPPEKPARIQDTIPTGTETAGKPAK
jgi:lipopolysaccharide export system protein LptA